MLRTYRKWGDDMKAFCIKHYITSDIYDEDERKKVDFFEKYHGCLQAAGVKKGKKYCDDTLSAHTPPKPNEDFYNCYKK